MGRLIYSAIASLDGFVADVEGNFDWSMPDDAVHRFVNDMLRPVQLHLYGRRMYEVLVAWEDPAMDNEAEDYVREFAQLWRAADKVVYSRTLQEPSSARTRIERSFDANTVRDLVAASSGDVLIAGPEIAALAFEAGLVDEYRTLVSPVAVGSGKRALPNDRALEFELHNEQRFANGVVYLEYGVVR